MNTIAAIATPMAVGGISVLRISGSEAKQITSKIFQPISGKDITNAAGYTAHFGKVMDSDGIFDEGIATVFNAPKSYTGEDVVEISCHGGIYITKRLLRAAIAAGAAPAQNGEFTKRAFLNGKMDLTAAESVMDLIAAQGEQAAKAALLMNEGSLWREVQDIKSTLLMNNAHIAAFIDYPEDDVPQLKLDEIKDSLQQCKDKLHKLTDSFDCGKLLREGVDTAIVGKPNVGKSTLMNLLSGCERSIVTDIPGTTRDTVEETVQLGQVTLKLCDTAGIHSSNDTVEKIGIERAKRRLDTAQLIIAVFDSSKTLEQDDFELIEQCRNKRAIAVINKTDLKPALDFAQIEDCFNYVVQISALERSSLEKLISAVESATNVAGLDISAAMLSTERQKQCVDLCINAIDEAIIAVDMTTLDAIGVLLDDAIAAILSLTGERVTDAVVDEVFSRFCVGK